MSAGHVLRRGQVLVPSRGFASPGFSDVASAFNLFHRRGCFRGYQSSSMELGYSTEIIHGDFTEDTEIQMIF